MLHEFEFKIKISIRNLMKTMLLNQKIMLLHLKNTYSV